MNRGAWQAVQSMGSQSVKTRLCDQHFEPRWAGPGVASPPFHRRKLRHSGAVWASITKPALPALLWVGLRALPRSRPPAGVLMSAYNGLCRGPELSLSVMQQWRGPGEGGSRERPELLQTPRDPPTTSLSLPVTWWALQLGSLCRKDAVMGWFVVQSHVWLFATLWAVARQALLSMGFPRQEYWSGLPFPPPVTELFSTQGLNSHLQHWQMDSLPSSHQGNFMSP